MEEKITNTEKLMAENYNIWNLNNAKLKKYAMDADQKFEHFKSGSMQISTAILKSIDLTDQSLSRVKEEVTENKRWLQSLQEAYEALRNSRDLGSSLEPIPSLSRIKSPVNEATHAQSEFPASIVTALDKQMALFRELQAEFAETQKQVRELQEKFVMAQDIQMAQCRTLQEESIGKQTIPQTQFLNYIFRLKDKTMAKLWEDITRDCRITQDPYGVVGEWVLCIFLSILSVIVPKRERQMKLK